MKRLDSALFELGLAPSRTKAQELIAGGEVEAFVGGKWKRITQSSFKIEDPSTDGIRINPSAPLLKYVSRAGLKLEGALEQLKLEVLGWRALDVGISTGGFTDCLLQRGCRQVIGVDVGHGQLAAKLADDPRVKLFEGINARDLDTQIAVRAEMKSESADTAGARINLCVVDLSFISLQLVLPALAAVLPVGSHLLALVKPQFEAGPTRLGSGGVVRDERVFAEVRTEILRALAKCGFSTQEQDYFPSCVKGQDGNQEFFVHALRA